MELSNFIWFVIGLLALLGGAELLVRGASNIATFCRIPPILVGLTIVAFGTSAPETAVSVKAALEGHSDIVVGTNIGSTIFNILFILGLCALITPLQVASRLVQIDVPIMIAAHLLLFAVAFQGWVGISGATVLLGAFVLYLAFIAFSSRSVEEKSSLPSEGRAAAAFKIALQLAIFIAGLALIVFGADRLLGSSVNLARDWGISELVISTTLIAAGTSLPELATSFVAALRGQRDIAVGNVVGSSIFNVLANIGLAAVVSGGVAFSREVLTFELTLAIVCSIVCLPIFFTGHRISRWEGGLFLGYYMAYTLYLILAAKGHWSAPMLSVAMGGFILPLTFVTLGVFLFRSFKR